MDSADSDSGVSSWALHIWWNDLIEGKEEFMIPRLQIILFNRNRGDWADLILPMSQMGEGWGETASK